jgi:hypothetical protein
MTLSLAPDLILGLLALAFFKLLGGAGLGAALVAVVSEFLGRTRQKAFLDKFGQQAAALGFKALTASLAGTACGLAFLASARKVDLQALAASAPALALIALPLLLTVVLAAHALSWRAMRQNKGGHLALGGLAGLLALALPVAAAVLAVALPGGGPSLAAQLGLAAPDAGSSVASALDAAAGAAATGSAGLASGAGSALAAPLALAGLAWCLCAAGGVVLLYLLHRRERDDFGRDYYQYALRTASRWALAGLAATVACGAWLAFSLPGSTRAGLLAQVPALAVLGGALLVCGAAWAATATSRNPLTMKWLLGLAGLGLWLAQGALAFLVLALA